MVYDYLVAVKNERGKYINSVSILLCLISVAFFINQQIKQGKQFFIFIIAVVLILAGLAWNRYQVRKHNRIIYYRRILLFTGVVWLGMPFLQWLAAPLFILAFLEKSAKMPLEIGVTSDKVVIDSLIKREFNWKAFNNVMLKDGLLTLDFKNNRLFQKETADETDLGDEIEFNEYCQKQLLNTPKTTLS